MKRILMLFLVVISTMAVYAQSKGFISTGQNVNVRTGPGKNYPVDSSWGPRIQLSKGDIVSYEGKTKNGFHYVRIVKYRGSFLSGDISNTNSGWVSSQFLSPVKICNSCGGSGEDYNSSIGALDTCRKCRGKGYYR